MVYNTSTNYMSGLGPSCDTPNYGINSYNYSYDFNNSQQQRNIIHRKMPSHSSIYNATHPFVASEYSSDPGARNICVHVNGKKKHCDLKQMQYYDNDTIHTNDTVNTNNGNNGNTNNVENKYIIEKRNCCCNSSTCHSLSKRPNKCNYKSYELQQHEDKYSDEEDSSYRNNRNGNNTYHIVYNKNGEIKNERKKTKEQMVNINYQDEEEEEEREEGGENNNEEYKEKCHCRRMSEDLNYSNEQYRNNNYIGTNGGNTYINIKVDDRTGYSNDSYDESEEEYNNNNNNEYDNEGYNNKYRYGDATINNNQGIINTKFKKRRHRKFFMGKYYLSDLKDTFMTPLYACAPHPTLVLPNPNLICYGIVQKQNEMHKKPEIVVRY